MLDETILEQRLITLEQAVSELQTQATSKPNSKDWLENIIGSVSDEAAFAEALAYGRIFRQSNCPTDLTDKNL